MQAGIVYDRVYEVVDGPFLGMAEIELVPGKVTSGAAGWSVAATNNDACVVVNRLLRAGVRVLRGTQAPHAWFVPVADGVEPRLKDLARDLGIDFIGEATAPLTRPIEALRIGVFDPWGGNMESGWTQWVLDQHEFRHQRVFGDAIEAGNLRANFDVLLFATGLPSTSPAGDVRSRPGGGGDEAPAAGATTDDVITKVLAVMPPFEDWSKQRGRNVRVTRERGVANLRAFVEQGGTLLVFPGQTQRAARHFDLPVEVGLYRDEGGERRAVPSRDFFIPGSLVAMHSDTTASLAAGTPAQVAAMFRRSDAFTVKADAGERARVIASYGQKAELLSGWALGIQHLDGKAAVVECKVGQGRVVLYGADVIYRGQPAASFKLVFNALY